MLGKESITEAPSVLMARNSAEGVLLTVKDEAVIGIDLEGTATEAAAYVIKDLTESRMCWVALDDETNVCVYVRADIPKDIYSAYVPDVKEEEK